ncbi:MAG TPA: S53 family peptidase [Rhizomicrobium sp.]|nr:S53 family peptidase [Rhizomicrobium sp.]
MVFRAKAAAMLAIALLAASPAFAHPLLTPHMPDVVESHSVAVAGTPDAKLHLTLQVVLPMRNRDALKTFVDAVTDPRSPLFRHYLSVTEFTKRFGPTARDYEAAAKFFAASGLSITGRAPNRYLLQVEGDVATVERVFHIKLNLYRHPTENRSFMAPDREPTLDLSVPVLNVAGLDDYALPYPKYKAPRGGDVRAHKWQGSGPDGWYIGSDFRAAYYGNGPLTGAGQSVGLFEFHGYDPANVALYFETVGQQNNVPVNGVSTDGTNAFCDECADGEQVLDIQYAASMAPGLDQIQVYVGKTAIAILNRMATDNTSKAISVSWGWKRNFKTEDPIYLEMAAQGQTVLIASGDDSSLKASGQWPEEDANLVAVGGTDLVTNGPGGAWVSESGWNASGGGPSLDKHIGIEPYQLPFITRKNGGSKKLRNVPDVSANANYNMFSCYHNRRCEGGWGGTSFSAPMWAGFIAMANEQAAQHSKPAVGFFNAQLYDLMRTTPSTLHDPRRHKSGEFSTVKGYDLVTGLGSPNGQTLIDALAGD